MAAEPGDIIRTLRKALAMSQAEFARAAGWSPSTISSWERGKTKPSRVALKTVLVFAEERGVRYRPKSAARTALTVVEHANGGAHPGAHGLQAAREVHGGRAGTGWIDGEASRLWLPPASRVGETPPRSLSIDATGRRWRAEAHFRISLDRPARGTPHTRSAVGMFGTLAVSACVVLLLVGRPARERPVPPALGVRSATVMPIPVAARNPRDDRVATNVPAAPAGPGAIDADEPLDAEPGETQPAAAPPPATRLESVVFIGANRHATFRTSGDPRTVLEGETVGAHHVVAIEPDRVTLIDEAGEAQVVRLGHSFPAE